MRLSYFVAEIGKPPVRAPRPARAARSFAYNVIDNTYHIYSLSSFFTLAFRHYCPYTIPIQSRKEVIALASHKHRAVLVLPDIGVSEEKVHGLTHEFQNSIVGTLRKAGSRVAEDGVVIVVVVIIEAEGARQEEAR